HAQRSSVARPPDAALAIVPARTDCRPRSAYHLTTPRAISTQGAPAMKTLRRFLRYNTWANGRVVDLCRSLDADLLRDDAGGTLGSVEGTLIHLVTVEESYLAMLQGRDLAAAFGSREEYRAHDLAWFLDRAAALADGYASLLDARDAAWLA